MEQTGRERDRQLVEDRQERQTAGRGQTNLESLEQTQWTCTYLISVMLNISNSFFKSCKPLNVFQIGHRIEPGPVFLSYYRRGWVEWILMETREQQSFQTVCDAGMTDVVHKSLDVICPWHLGGNPLHSPYKYTHPSFPHSISPKQENNTLPMCNLNSSVCIINYVNRVVWLLKMCSRVLSQQQFLDIQ